MVSQIDDGENFSYTFKFDLKLGKKKNTNKYHLILK